MSNSTDTERAHDYQPAAYPTAMPGASGELNGRDARSYATYTKALWDEQTEGLRPFHLIWQQNLLFIANQHHHTLTSSGWRIVAETDTWKQKPTYNMCLPFFNTFLAKATKSRPATQCIPASSEPKDMQAAQLGDELIEAKWTELKAQRRYRHIAGWTIATGNGFALPFYNHRAGKIKRLEVEVECPVYEPDGVTQRMHDPDGDGMMVPETEIIMVPCDKDGEPQLGADNRPRPGAKAHVIDEGEIDFRIYSPFQVRVDPEATCDEDVTWFDVVEPMSLRAILKRWPEKGKKVGAEDVSTIMATQQTLSGVMDPRVTDNSAAGASPADERARDMPRALVHHYYEKQTPEYPEGRYWCTAGDVLLEGPMDLPDGLFKLIHMVDVLIPGRYHGMSRMEAAVSINREYNALKARIMEHHRLFANGKYLVPTQAGMRKGSMSPEPGVERYTWPYKPEAMQIPALPQSVFMELQQLLSDFERVTGLRAVSQGGTDGGVTAGIAIMQLQEADDADLGPFLQSAEEAIADLAGAWLILIKNNYTDERVYYAAGPGKRYMVKSFRASDLEGAVDVVPQSGSSRPGSEVARQAVIMELAGTVPAMFNDPETGQFDQARFARAMQLGGIEAAYESEDLDVSEALREEEQFSLMGGIEEAEPVTPQPWQSHRIHRRQHRRTLAGGEWREWPQEAQDAFLAHYLLTVQMDEQEQMRLAMMAGAAQGVAAGMPQPPMGEPGMDVEPMPPEGGPDMMDLAADPMGGEADMLEQDLIDASGGAILN